MKQTGNKPKRNNLRAFLFLFPIVFCALLFVYYPFARMIVNSFCRLNGKGVIKGFAGLENYRYLFGREDFRQALRHTLIIAAVNVPLTLFITTFLALLTCKEERTFGRLNETLIALPMSVPMSAACMIFKAMFSPSVGIINAALGLKCGWFESRETALLSCIILTVWMGIGFDYLLILSALRNIPKQILEVMRVDGIPLLRRVFRVQLPIISPTLFYVFITNLILCMMTSAPMIIIIGARAEASAANTLISLMFQSGFSNFDYSLAAAVSLIAFILTMGLVLPAFGFARKKGFFQ